MRTKIGSRTERFKAETAKVVEGVDVNEVIEATSVPLLDHLDHVAPSTPSAF
jgi:hypothetical protein